MFKEEADFVKRKVTYFLRSLTRPNVINHYGVDLYIGAHMSGALKKSIFKGGYEDKEVEILHNKLEKKDRVIDIGAGIGFLSCFCALIIGEDNVCAIEANPNLIAHIRKNFSLNSVEPSLMNRLISTNGKTFFLENDFWSSSTVKRSHTAKEVEVETVSINELISEFKGNFLIMDIEGSEKDVIPELDFSHVDKLLIELHPHVIGPECTSKLLSHIIDQGMILDMAKLKGNVFFFYRVNTDGTCT